MKLRIFITTGLLMLMAAGLYLLTHTTPGSRLFTRTLAARLIGYEDMAAEAVNGNIWKGLSYENLVLTDITDLPPGTVVKIQRMFIQLNSFGLDGLNVELENTRLILPDADPLVISGTLKGQQLDVNIHSQGGFTLTELLSYLPNFKALIPFKGDVSDIDLYVTGHYLEPMIKGEFTISEFVYKGFMLTDVPVVADVQIKNARDDIKLYGYVSTQAGQFRTKRTVVRLGPSDLYFSGAWNQPKLNINGTSSIEKAKITIALKGSVEKPDLALNSEPPYPRERLMMMLATGKSWQSLDTVLTNEFNSSALTKDFIDYFLFAGKSNIFAERFGISEFSVTYNDQQKGVSVKKEIGNQLEVGYSVKETQTTRQEPDISHTVGGEYKITDKTSLGVEREMTTKQPTGELLDEKPVVENKDTFFLKYKTTF